ncbi:unnamed protein product [Rotaria magnacalcarata]|uniref:LRAT domain-containing protein n=2 Tax=Rotaria magnacalcarata TaxID=392030 RepID=A0A816H4J2_9BILA|nr:unnamed protein product [Rotaria magnacalcarata]CAF1683039.1 unnamed protein product [Rotaria magnacalcarata]CAF2232422.1 unnamed protein product [Rotaria magnacalcarata]CAF3812865.1 unnamed protein product [Rotaria magnacalcarata]CAF3963457.1 unnamed protein product [Rotaria magnacalcarata]
MTDRYRLLPEFKEQVTEVIKTFIHQERPFQHTRKEKITDLNRLEPGDHISFYKTDLYYAHHGIVCEARTTYLRVIHYFNTLQHARTALMRGSIYIAAIIESEWPVKIESTSEDIYLHHYDNIPCFSKKETLERAFSQLDRRGYSLLGNNCEHWARWCRTGEHYSEQIYKLRGLVKEKSATLLIVDPTALLVKDVALVGVRTFGQFLSAVGSGVIFTAVESISAFIDIKNKKHEREKGSLSDVALKKYVVRRVTSASTAVVGGTAGTVVGTILIPVPILGATVGGFVGSISGKLIGGVSGIALSKIFEVYEKVKESKIKKMSTVSQLMTNTSPSSELVHYLMMIADDREKEEPISNIIEQPLNSHSLIYPSLEKFTNNTQNTTAEEYQAVTKLTTELFTDSNSYDYFILTPMPDSNAAEEFASSTDLLLLRWPIGIVKPWESQGEHVMDIDDSNLNQE